MKGLGLPEHDHSSPIIAVEESRSAGLPIDDLNHNILIEIDTLRYLPSCDGQENSPSSVVASLNTARVSPSIDFHRHATAYLAIIVKRDRCLRCIRCLDKDELVLPDFVQNTLCKLRYA